MRVCDRCGEQAVDEVILKAEDLHVDVCEGCRQDVLVTLRPKEIKRRGRPPKNLEKSK